MKDCLNIDDIETVATKQLSRKAWAYYFSASDDMYSKSLNTTVYRSILLRPRVFVDCTRCDTSTPVLGQRVSVPFSVAPAAMARLAHPAGEHGIAQACATFGALQIISNNASQTPEQIVADAAPAARVVRLEAPPVLGSALLALERHASAPVAEGVAGRLAASLTVLGDASGDD